MRTPFKKVTAAVLAVMMVFCLFGCETQKLDQVAETEPVLAATTQASTVPETTEATLGEDDYFSIDDAAESDIDEEKYEEKQVTVVISSGVQQGQDEYLTDPVPEGQQMPVEPGEIEIDTSTALTCYLTIDCSTILYNMENLTEGKDILVPSDGVLLPRTAVTFYAGESVFDVLQRVTMENRIHMSSRFTPIYNSASIEAIGNLSEFDCGSGSGWMSNVNGWYPNYGVSRYVLQDGDDIQFNYTCDLGRDLGAEMPD